MIDEQAEPASARLTLTRRERRLQRRPRRLQRLVGWLGYGLSVVGVVVAASWLAVEAGTAPPRSVPVRRTTATSVETGGVQPVASTVAPVTAPPTAPPSVGAPVTTASSTTTSTTTTTQPVLAAAVTPESAP